MNSDYSITCIGDGLIPGTKLYKVVRVNKDYWFPHEINQLHILNGHTGNYLISAQASSVQQGEQFIDDCINLKLVIPPGWQKGTVCTLASGRFRKFHKWRIVTGYYFEKYNWFIHLYVLNIRRGMWEQQYHIPLERLKLMDIPKEQVKTLLLTYPQMHRYTENLHSEYISNWFDIPYKEDAPFI